MALFLSAIFLSIAFSALALFQLAIVFGAPLGEYAYGGRNPGVLPRQLRLTSVFSFLLSLALAGHYLAQLGVLLPVLGSDLNRIANWVLVCYLLLGTFMNWISRSKKERYLWGPVTLLMLGAAVVVALNL